MDKVGHNVSSTARSVETEQVAHIGRSEEGTMLAFSWSDFRVPWPGPEYEPGSSLRWRGLIPLSGCLRSAAPVEVELYETRRQVTSHCDKSFVRRRNFGQKFDLPNASTWDAAAWDSAVTSQGHVPQSAHPCPKTQRGPGPLLSTQLLHPRGAAVAERLDCSSPTKANRVQSLAGSLPDFRILEIVPDDAASRRGEGKREIPEKTCRPTASSGTIPTCLAGYLTRIALVGGEQVNRSATVALNYQRASRLIVPPPPPGSALSQLMKGGAGGGVFTATFGAVLQAALLGGVRPPPSSTHWTGVPYRVAAISVRPPHRAGEPNMGPPGTPRWKTLTAFGNDPRCVQILSYFSLTCNMSDVVDTGTESVNTLSEYSRSRITCCKTCDIVDRNFGWEHPENTDRNARAEGENPRWMPQAVDAAAISLVSGSSWSYGACGRDFWHEALRYEVAILLVSTGHFGMAHNYRYLTMPVNGRGWLRCVDSGAILVVSRVLWNIWQGSSHNLARQYRPEASITYSWDPAVIFLVSAKMTAVEWLECSSPTKGNRVRAPAESVVSGDAAGRRVSSGICRFSRPCIPTLLHPRFTFIGSQDPIGSTSVMTELYTTFPQAAVLRCTPQTVLQACSVSVARIVLPLLDLGRGSPSHSQTCVQHVMICEKSALQARPVECFQETLSSDKTAILPLKVPQCEENTARQLRVLCSLAMAHLMHVEASARSLSRFSASGSENSSSTLELIVLYIFESVPFVYWLLKQYGPIYTSDLVGRDWTSHSLAVCSWCKAVVGAAILHPRTPGGLLLVQSKPASVQSSVGAAIFREIMSRQDTVQSTVGSSSCFDWLKHVLVLVNCLRTNHKGLVSELRNPEWRVKCGNYSSSQWRTISVIGALKLLRGLPACPSITDGQYRRNLILGAAVAERLDYSPPNKAMRVQSPAGSLPDFRRWEILPDDAAGWRVCSGISRFPPPLHSSAAPFSPRFTLIGSQDLVIGSRRNLSTQLDSICLTQVAASTQSQMANNQREATRYKVVSGVVWTNRTTMSSNTGTNRTGVLKVPVNVCRPQCVNLKALHHSNKFVIGTYLMRRAVGNFAPIDERITIAWPNHEKFSKNVHGFTDMQQPMEKRGYTTVDISLMPNNNANFAVPQLSLAAAPRHISSTVAPPLSSRLLDGGIEHASRGGAFGVGAPHTQQVERRSVEM
ncbi:hypothetical protein PR048_022564 [Dryococelus australis]|uniref:Uncharacterized protein n=1 Tax=Dryococelus australis TaxID=614101 RepID=A0ABQ9H1G0_9NEOP|nr:hypothetical protein PR048_022564 [Dryococelus australis]